MKFLLKKMSDFVQEYVHFFLNMVILEQIDFDVTTTKYGNLCHLNCSKAKEKEKYAKMRCDSKA